MEEQYKTIIPKIFLKYAIKNKDKYFTLEKTYNYARFDKPFEVFLASIFFYTLILTIMVFLIIFSFFYFIQKYLFNISLIYSLFITFSISPLFFIIYYNYPYVKSISFIKSLDAELKPTIEFMLKEAEEGTSPYNIFKKLMNSDLKTVSKEAAYIIDLVDNKRKMLLEAITKAAEESPSKKFKEFLFGINLTIRSGTGLTNFLRNELNSSV